jgi:3-phenylpropionate/trans-cinnamate dioxygenase ferredoxin component
MSEFYRVCKTSDVVDPGKNVFDVDGRFVLIFHLDGKFYALDDVCTHDGGSLCEGVIEGFQVICPRHGARFDILTGQALTMPAVHATASHEVRIEGNDVFVKFADD